MLHLKHITLDKKGVLPVVTGLILLFWVTRSFMIVEPVNLCQMAHFYLEGKISFCAF